MKPRRQAWLFLCSLGLVGACDVDIYHDLSERRASESLLTLRAAGIRADKRLEARGSAGRPSTFALTVPRSDETRALALLTERGLPRPPEPSAGSSNKLLFLPSAQREGSAATQSAMLAETLERMPEIIEARVHLALPEPEPLSSQGSLRPSAAVYLKLRAPLVVSTVEIAQLVAHSVPGLDAQDVSVLAAQAPTLLPGGAAALSQLGPLRFAPESRPALLFLLTALVVLTLACAGLGFLAWPRRKRATRSETPTATAGTNASVFRS